MWSLLFIVSSDYQVEVSIVYSWLRMLLLKHFHEPYCQSLRQEDPEF